MTDPSLENVGQALYPEHGARACAQNTKHTEKGKKKVLKDPDYAATGKNRASVALTSSLSSRSFLFSCEGRAKQASRVENSRSIDPIKIERKV